MQSIARRAAGEVFRDRDSRRRTARQAAKEMDQIARDVLANPVIEDIGWSF